jgi:hypothetical protein
MASKKKPNPGTSEEDNASTEVPPSTNNALITINNDNNNEDEDHGEDVSIEELAEGEFEVDLLDLCITTEDIQAMR